MLSAIIYACSTKTFVILSIGSRLPWLNCSNIVNSANNLIFELLEVNYVSYSYITESFEFWKSLTNKLFKKFYNSTSWSSIIVNLVAIAWGPSVKHN